MNTRTAMKTMATPRLRLAWAGLLSVLVSTNAATQDNLSTQAQRRPDYQRLVINSDGSLVYVEPLDETLLNRLEYTNRLRPTLEIFFSDADGDRRISILDYDSDARPDFIRIERTPPDHTVEAVSFYRGPMHKLHEEGHLDHALKHSFIQNDSSLASEIRERLEAMRARQIGPEEIGVFSGYSLFAGLELPVIGEAFQAADSLFRGVEQVTSLNVQNLRNAPELAHIHRQEILKLLSINPHTLGTESD